MVFAWAVLIPLGILSARYLKILPIYDWPNKLDNQVWWYSHLVLQYTGAILVIIATAFIFLEETSGFWETHKILGWCSIGLLVIQVFSGLIRGSKGGPTEPAPDRSWRGDHYDMTLHRKIFEYYHKSFGYIAFLVACAAVISGLWASNAPVWMWIVIPIWWVVLATTFMTLQLKGLAHDTYQAIWGPGKEHPGNNMEPIGWGIKRLSVSSKKLSPKEVGDNRNPTKNT